MKKYFIYLLIIINLIVLIPKSSYSNGNSFNDVPNNHWANNDIKQLRALNITEGIGNNLFGLGKTISRAEFVTFLVRINSWDLIVPDKSLYKDNNTKSWYYSYIETALNKGVLLADANVFRPDDPITREEMALMIVRSLGFDYLALELNNSKSPFADVKNNIGYITLLKDFGIVTGSGNNMFNPLSTATREEAAAILVRMYNLVNKPIIHLHGFYSYMGDLQKDIINKLDSISYDWLTLEYDTKTYEVKLKSSISSTITEPARPTQLMLFADNSKTIILEDGSSSPFVTYLLSNKNIKAKLINDIISELNNSQFDGITIDFESLKGNDNAILLNSFLLDLREELDTYNKTLYVAVPPKTYFDGYDYSTIGDIADQVILMAHDYEAKRLNVSEMERGYTNTPLTPIKYIYNDLKAITDPINGVKDLNKIWLQISFSSAQWQLKNDKVVNSTPYVPTYKMIQERLIQDQTKLHYDVISQNPYATYYNEELGIHNKIWYEDSRSVSEKIKLAKMFKINGISLWSIGNIPDYPKNTNTYLDVWQTILNSTTSNK